MVGADADVVARTVGRAALAHEDVAGNDVLAAELLEAEALALGFAAVLGLNRLPFYVPLQSSEVFSRQAQAWMPVILTSV